MTPELPHELLEFLGQDEGEGALAVQLARTWDTWILEVDLVRVYSGVEVRVTGDTLVVRGEAWLHGEELQQGVHHLALGDRVLWWEDEALVQARIIRARGLPVRPRVDRGQLMVLGLAASLLLGLFGAGLWQVESRRWAEPVRAEAPIERVVRVVLPPGLGEDHPDIEDRNVAAGPGQSQSGPSGRAGAPAGGEQSGSNLRTRGQSTDRSPARVEQSAISVLAARGVAHRPGRSVTGLTSTAGANRLGLGDERGPGLGYRGQLAHGTGNGAEGILTELAGLYELGHGLGAAGRGFGPGEGDTGDGDLHGALGGPAEAAPFFQVGQGQVQMVLLEADRSSWVTTRQSLRAQSHVNPASVAVEDFINALDYGETPTVGVQLTAQVAAHPAEPDLLLMRVGVLVGHGARVPADVTLVVDDSCSMEGVEDLARETTRALVQGLNPDDRVRLAPLNAPSTKLLSPDEPALLKAVDQLAATGGSPIAMGLTNALDLAAKDPRHGHVILITDGESTGIADAAAAAWEAGLGFSIVVVDDRGWGRGVRELERAGLVGGSVVHRVDSSEEAERIGSIAGQLVSPLELPGLEVRFDVEGVKSSRLFGYGSRNVMAVEGGTGDGEPVRPGAVGPGNVVSVLFELEVHTGVDRIGSIELPGMAEPLEVHLGDGDPRLARLAYAAGGFAESLQGSKFRTASLGQLGRIVDTDRFNPSHRDLRELLMLAMRSY